MSKVIDNIKKLFKPRNTTGNINGFRDFNNSLNYSTLTNTIKTLNEQEFLTFGLLVRAVQLIANDIGKVNFRHLKANKHGEYENIQESEIAKILNKRPTATLTPWEFKKILIWNLLLYGNAPIFIIRDESEKIKELIPIYPDYITKQEENGIISYVFKSGSNPAILLREKDVIYISYELIQGYENLSIRTLFKSTISKVKENELAMINAIKNDVSYSAFIKIRDATNQSQRELANQALKQMLENHKKNGSFGIVIDEKWEMGKASEIVNMRIDFQTRNALGREFAASLGIPPAKLGIDDPNKYNSSAELNRAYIDNSLKPLLTNITQRFTYSLLENEQEIITFKTLDLLSIDLKSIQEFASSAINNGYATANEIRALIGLDKHPDGDFLLANGTLTPVKVLQAQYNNPPEQQKPPLKQQESERDTNTPETTKTPKKQKITKGD
ncbi:phage portal protein [Mesomycoplasma molare]|uniref:Phage portal protein n=1 Tax=Mesomycoplasma molare TaxID=171288 RepID=A0ABY5TWV2_9BACT|nr:phage portal protein [Mesomycoplasma molare]UWD34061.1 phage portal protein [Mesomycoplasma molare]